MWKWLAGLGIVIAGAALYKKPAGAQPAARPDWSGCGAPPAYCQPPPRYACQARVTVDLDGFTKGAAYTVTGRTWSPIPGDGQGRGLWIYDLRGPGIDGKATTQVSEEANVLGTAP